VQAAPPTLSAEARLRDPAHRDQDGAVWRRDRFAERVRRQWNPVEVRMAGGPDPVELEELAAAIQAKVGGDVGHVRQRLEEFARMDEAGAPPAVDPLVRPGAPAGGH
jgi:hypothetical protein